MLPRLASKPRLESVTRLAVVAMVICVGLAIAFTLHSILQIRDEAAATRKRVLSDIIDRQRTILNVDKLLRYGEALFAVQGRERRRTLVMAQALAREMTNESDPRLRALALRVSNSLSGVAADMDGFQEKNEAASLLFREFSVFHLDFPLTREPVDHTASDCQHALWAELVQLPGTLIETLPSVKLAEQRQRLTNLLHAGADYTACLPPDVDVALVTSRIEAISLEMLRLKEEALEHVHTAREAWEFLAEEVETLSRALTEEAARTTAQDLGSIEAKARQALRTGSADMAVLLAIALVIILLVRAYILKPAQAAANALLEAELHNAEVRVPRTTILEFDVLGRGVERLGALLAQQARRSRELEDLVAERTADLEAKAHALEEANTRLREIDSMKSAFLSTVSHELRTPLTSLVGYAKLILKKFRKHFRSLAQGDPVLEKNAAQIEEDLRIILLDGERLTRMINDVLDLHRIEAGRMQWRIEEISPAELVARAQAVTSGFFARSDAVRLLTEVKDGLPSVRVDADRILQVLINLVNNASKYTTGGSVTIRALAGERGEVVFQVADTGVGIAPADLDRIFERFYILKPDTLSGKPSGAGLGLTICREIVAGHGGRIWAESRSGHGSVFSFTIPVSPAED